MLITGSALLLVYISAQIHGFVMSRAALWSFAAHQSRSAEAKPVHEVSLRPQTDFRLWSAARIRRYKDALAMKVAEPLAVLSIPRIGLQVPVFEGTGDLTLNRGAGRIAGTARPGEPGNIGIAAHRDGFFRGLKDIHVGDRIELNAQEGAFVYTVDKIEIVKPTDVDVLRSRPQPTLTLVTCYPFYFVGDASQRYIVHASLLDTEKASRLPMNSTARRIASQP